VVPSLAEGEFIRRGLFHPFGQGWVPYKEKKFVNDTPPLAKRT